MTGHGSTRYSCCVQQRLPSRISPWLCPVCLREVVGQASSEEPDLAMQEAFALQSKAWDRKERRFAPPSQPLVKEYLDLLLQKGASVEGEVDPETGRFYLREIRCASGRLLLGVKEGSCCIYQHEVDEDGSVCS